MQFTECKNAKTVGNAKNAIAVSSHQAAWICVRNLFIFVTSNNLDFVSHKMVILGSVVHRDVWMIMANFLILSFQ